MLVLTEAEVESLLDPDECVEAVERGFAVAGLGGAYDGFRSHVLVEAGAFHVVGGGFAAPAGTLAGFKINGRMTGGVRGVMLLCDAEDGSPVALFATGAFTAMRTAAVAAVAARALCVGHEIHAVVVGSGRLAGAVGATLARLPSVTRVVIGGRTPERRRGLAARLAETAGAEIVSAEDLTSETRAADLVVTATSATAPVLDRRGVRPGAVVVALGADAPGKQELEPGLVASSMVVVDDLAQCAATGELGHALRAGLLTLGDVHADLGAVVARVAPAGRLEDETVVFDSVGTAVADVAVARLLVEKAGSHRLGRQVPLG